MNDVRVVQYGCGKMSSYTMRYVEEKGGKVVGAIDVNPNLIGHDIAEVIGSGDNRGVKIVSVSDAEEMLHQVSPDICIIETMSLMADCKDAFMLCAKMGVNAISTCEEAFYPMVSSPTITKEIDALAKETDCTITGSGYQDIFWGNLITTLAGSTHKITKIKGSSSYNVEDYGIALAKAHGAGLSLADFDKEVAANDNITDEERKAIIEEGTFLPSYMWNASAWICNKLGLTIKRQSQKCVPITYTEDIHSETLGMDIKAGDAIGMSAVVTTETNEGIIIEAECVGKVYAPGVVDRNEWTIEGEPDTTVVITEPKTVELTCASVVNRIPDVLAEEAGYVPTSVMGELTYIV